MRESKSARKIILLGKTGDGKSRCGNTILGEQRFTIESSPLSITDKCTTEAAMVGGRTVSVIDTPGFFDTGLEEEFVKTLIIKSIIECAPAVDALVIVLKVQRFTRQEIEILDKIVEYFGEEAFNHAVFLFTHGAELEGQTIEAFVQKNPKLQEFVDKCGGRCHVVDNKHWNDCHVYRSNKFQVKNLLDTIDKMVEENGRFTNELLLNTEEEVQEEINSMLIGNLSTEEKREVAKKNVLKKHLIRFAGVTTGILIGAFLGIGVAVASVVALLKAAKLKEVVKVIGIAVTAAGTVADKTAVAAAAATGGTAGVGMAAASAVAGAVEAGVAAGAGVVAVEAGVAAGATGAALGVAASGTVAVEAGVAAGAGIGAAAGSGIAAGVIFGAAALAGAVRGGFTGYKAAEEADSVLDAIKMAAKVNYENAKDIVKKAEGLPSNIYKKIQ